MKYSARYSQIIHRIRSKEFSPIYFLIGSDAFLQDFFIKELISSFLNSEGYRKQYSMDLDSTQSLLNDLYENSFFVTKRIFVVREIHRLKTSQKDFLGYLKSPNPNNCLLLIHEGYNIKGKFLDSIKKSSISTNVSPPFEEKIHDWAKYILKLKGFNISQNELDAIIKTYGDSIASVINEVEKISLMQGDNNKINFKEYLSKSKNMREYFLWNLLDNLGMKTLDKSLLVYESIINQGISPTQVVVQLSEFFKILLMLKTDTNSPITTFYFNKIIQKRLSSYNIKYKQNEIENIILQLRNIDLYLKSTTLSQKNLFHPLFIGICKGIYV